MAENNFKEKNEYNISILGDSISTYVGFNPYGYPVYYTEDKLYDNELESVNDTWWKFVIDKLNGKLCVNNSFSGCLVSGDSEYSACSSDRCSSLHAKVMPDLVLIFVGTNDRGYKIDIGKDEPKNIMKFYGAYRTMLERIKRNYPYAKIVCSSLLRGYLKDSKQIACMATDEDYNNAIRQAVKAENCLLADIALSGECYETLDYCHPTRHGHKQIAKLWINALSDIL